MTLLGAYVWPRDDQREVWAGGLVALLSELGFREGAARVSLTRLARRDLIARRKQGRLVHYTLTDRARTVLAEGDSRIFTLGSNGQPGERWTLLWHAIPDTHRRAREALVRRLRFLGFGPIQDGTWLAVRDALTQVGDLLDELEVREHAGLMHCSPADAGDARRLIARAWDLDALAEIYAAFVAQFDGASAVDDATAFLLRTRLVHTFRQFPFRDPELPEELIKPPERRAEAVTLFHELYSALAPAAQRHFDEVTTP